jgi:hypothetical protein
MALEEASLFLAVFMIFHSNICLFFLYLFIFSSRFKLTTKTFLPPKALNCPIVPLYFKKVAEIDAVDAALTEQPDPFGQTKDFGLLINFFKFFGFD